MLSGAQAVQPSLKSVRAETHTLMDQLNEAENNKNTLIVFDLDFNLLYFKDWPLGSDPWVNEQFKLEWDKAKQQNPNMSDDEKRTLDEQITHRIISQYSSHMPKVPLDHVVPAEQAVIDKIKSMQNNGFQFMILTSRNTSPDVVEATYKHLEHIGLDFNRALFQDKTYQFNMDEKHVRLHQGVAMVSGANKGDCLSHILATLKLQTSNTVLQAHSFTVSFSDDSGSKVDSVLAAMKESGIPCTAWQNRCLDEEVQKIQAQMHLAEVQAQTFKQGVSGGEAQILHTHRSTSAPTLDSKPETTIVRGINGKYTLVAGGLSEEEAKEGAEFIASKRAITFAYQAETAANASSAANDDSTEAVCTTAPPGCGY